MREGDETGEAEWAGVHKDDEAGEAEWAGVEAGRGPANRDGLAERDGPTCMGGTGTESGTLIRSASGGDVVSCCCMLETENCGAKGNRVSSKTTWRDMMMRRVSRSMQR